MDYTPDQLHDLMMPNAADDVPYHPQSEQWSGDSLAMNEILVTHANYEYVLAHEQGNQYTATCTRTGRVKTRLNPNLWHNRHNGLVTDKALIEALENGVKALQRQRTSTGPRPPVGVPPAHHQPPTGRKAHHVTPREKRANGRAE